MVVPSLSDKHQHRLSQQTWEAQVLIYLFSSLITLYFGHLFLSVVSALHSQLRLPSMKVCALYQAKRLGKRQQECKRPFTLHDSPSLCLADEERKKHLTAVTILGSSVPSLRSVEATALLSPSHPHSQNWCFPEPKRHCFPASPECSSRWSLGKALNKEGQEPSVGNLHSAAESETAVKWLTQGYFCSLSK